MRWADDVRIETPEQVEVDLELAGLGSRFVAQIIDWSIKLIATVMLGVPVLVLLAVSDLSHELEKPSNLVLAAFLAVVYAVWLGYAVYFEAAWNGQTPGKRFAKIRAMQLGGAPLDFRAAGVRNLLSFVDFLPGFFLLGAVLVLLTGKKQRLGDLAAGTVVIRERVVDLGTDPADAVERKASAEVAFSPSHLTAFTAKDVAVVREVLSRFDSLDRAVRKQLAVRMAEKYAKQLGYPLPPDPRPEDALAFLASLVRDYQQARRHD